MYTSLEIEFIFKACTDADEIYQALLAFLWVKADGDLTDEQQLFIGEKSTQRVQQLKMV